MIGQLAKTGARLLGVVGIGIVAAFVTAGISAKIGVKSSAPGADPHSPEAYAAATGKMTGTLSKRAVDDIRPTDSTLIVLLRAHDIKGCEDLGRQLREVARVVAAGRPWHIVIVDQETPALKAFVDDERLTGVMHDIPSLQLLASGEVIVTPAALLVSRDGVIYRGITHPKRLPNVRARSFAAELGPTFEY